MLTAFFIASVLFAVALGNFGNALAASIGLAVYTLLFGTRASE